MSTGGGTAAPRRKGLTDGRLNIRSRCRTLTTRWKYAQDNHVQLPDEYDQIVRFTLLSLHGSTDELAPGSRPLPRPHPGANTSVGQDGLGEVGDVHHSLSGLESQNKYKGYRLSVRDQRGGFECGRTSRSWSTGRGADEPGAGHTGGARAGRGGILQSRRAMAICRARIRESRMLDNSFEAPGEAGA
jgi:hypothetical protein